MRISPNPTFDRLHAGVFRNWSSPNPGYRPQGSNDWLLILTLSGSGRLRLKNGTVLEARRGDLCIYKPRHHQWYEAGPPEGAWSIAWVHFHPRTHWIQWLSSLPCAEPGTVWTRLDDPALSKVRRRLLAMHWREKGSLPDGRDFAMNHLEAALLHIKGAVSAEEGPSCDPRVAKALLWLDRNLAQAVSVPELAKLSGLSVSGFAHRFRAAVGMAPLHYAQARRMERAEEMLRGTPLTVKEIASELGFSDPFYFSRLFSRSKGACPSEWRRAASEARQKA